MALALVVVAGLLACGLPAQRSRQVVAAAGAEFTAPRSMVGLPPFMSVYERTSVKAQYLVEGGLLEFRWFPDDSQQRAPDQQAANWGEYVTDKDHRIVNRKFRTKGQAVSGRGKQPAHSLWEYEDTLGEEKWFQLAAVFRLDGGELAVQHRAQARDLDAEKHRRRILPILQSVRPLSEPAADVEVPEALLADVKGETRLAAVKRLLRAARDHPGWEVFTTRDSAVLAGTLETRRDKRRKFLENARWHARDCDAARRFVADRLRAPDEVFADFFVVRISERRFDDELTRTPREERSGNTIFVYYRKWPLDGPDEVLCGSWEHDRKRVSPDKGGWEQFAIRYLGPENEPDGWIVHGYGIALELLEWVPGKPIGTIDDLDYHLRRFSKAFASAEDLRFAELLRLDCEEVQHREQRAAAILADFLLRGPNVLGRSWNPAWSGVLERYLTTLRSSGSREKARKQAFEGIDLGALQTAAYEWLSQQKR